MDLKAYLFLGSFYRKPMICDLSEPFEPTTRFGYSIAMSFLMKKRERHAGVDHEARNALFGKSKGVLLNSFDEVFKHPLNHLDNALLLGQEDQEEL